ncbi:MAG TPA: acyl-CoA dehydrogenase family protein [Noviherbaspirillum sp.]|jgi:alkylation response protein AidB-like acyl-CoA dehydrogenase|uniref:acyl-CoA dehydrogenase family protein n=1 Tax=Noviherbaspirillum sp. TaxID=1926288 RepID=UPI002DDCECB6|nr:acyl-CoA dehydrogenase family protein [Noviherbaspirillum sp.]HEV2609235.1 acyl-CoA dehydrogenase family protein [Noviherbaspirillum sp.]
MHFNFTPEQQQFSDALRRWIEKDYTFEHRNKIIQSEQGVSDQAWATLTELGMTALPVPEEQGGFNGSAVDMMVVMHEIGRGLVIEPYFATALGAQFLKLAGGQESLLEQVAGGELKLACALGEKQSRYELFDIATTAKANGGSYVLNGSKTVVLHGAQANQLIVSARSSGGQRDTSGISLFVVPADATGVSRREYRTLDGHRAADITLENVELPASALLGKEGAGWDVLDAAADYGATLLCAEAVGAMEALNEATLEYLKTRQQFGVPIGKFQALQHRMAEMFMQLEQARSMATLAAVKVSSADAEERRRTVSAAKARIGQALKFVGQQAVQLHGGMGVTNEVQAAHHFKRLTMIELTLGDTDYHLARFAAQPGFRKAA